MNVRFHNIMFDHGAYRSAKVDSNRLTVSLADEDHVIAFTNKEEALNELGELANILAAAERGLYAPSVQANAGESKLQEAKAVAQAAIDKLSEVLDVVKAKSADVPAPSEILGRLKTKATGSTAAGIIGKLKNKATEAIDQIDAQSKLNEVMGSFQDLIQQPVDEALEAIDAIEERLATAKPKTGEEAVNEVLDVLETLFAKQKDAIEDEPQADSEPVRITRDIPVERKRKSLLDDADVFGIDRSNVVQPVAVNEEDSGLLIPEEHWDDELCSFPEDQLRATLQHEINISAATEKVRNMFQTQGLSEDELQDMLADYLDMIMDAAQNNPNETLRALIEQLLR